jgi:hypothetical protein
LSFSSDTVKYIDYSIIDVAGKRIKYLKIPRRKTGYSQILAVFRGDVARVPAVAERQLIVSVAQNAVRVHRNVDNRAVLRRRPRPAVRAILVSLSSLFPALFGAARRAHCEFICQSVFLPNLLSVVLSLFAL